MWPEDPQCGQTAPSGHTCCSMNVCAASSSLKYGALGNIMPSTLRHVTFCGGWMQIAGRNALATLRLYGADQSTFVAWAIDDGAPRLIRARAIQSLLARDSSVV